MFVTLFPMYFPCAAIVLVPYGRENEADCGWIALRWPVASWSEVVTDALYCDFHCAVVIKDANVITWFSQSYYQSSVL